MQPPSVKGRDAPPCLEQTTEEVCDCMYKVPAPVVPRRRTAGSAAGRCFDGRLKSVWLLFRQPDVTSREQLLFRQLR